MRKIWHLLLPLLLCAVCLPARAQAPSGEVSARDTPSDDALDMNIFRKFGETGDFVLLFAYYINGIIHPPIDQVTKYGGQNL